MSCETALKVAVLQLNKIFLVKLKCASMQHYLVCVFRCGEQSLSQLQSQSCYWRRNVGPSCSQLVRTDSPAMVAGQVFRRRRPCHAGLCCTRRVGVVPCRDASSKSCYTGSVASYSRQTRLSIIWTSRPAYDAVSSRFPSTGCRPRPSVHSHQTSVDSRLCDSWTYIVQPCISGGGCNRRPENGETWQGLRAMSK